MQDPRNVADTVRRAALAAPDKAALIWQMEAVTWAKLDARVDELARALVALDLPQVDGYPARVAVAVRQTPEFAESYFGVLRAGLIAVPINTGLTGRQVARILADSGASVLIATEDVRARLGDAQPPPATYRPDELAEAGGPVTSFSGGEDIAVLLYTSGTEGDPKGVMLSHRAVLANQSQLAAIEPAPLVPDDVLLLALPVFHAYGLNAGLTAVAYHGATGVLLERFDPVESLRLITEHRVTAVLGVPSMYVAWSQLPDAGAAFARVRLATSGAAPLDPAVGKRFLAATGRPIFEGYGLTETAPVVTSTLASTAPKPGSIGRAIPGVSVKLVNAGGEEIALDDDDFDDDAPGSPGTDPGEIVVRGANLFSGYWPDGRERPGTDGWWATGDVAYADAAGDLFLVDRLREVIRVNGFNVYPYEVEQVLRDHPAVVEAAVLGVPHPDRGQAVKAFVVTRSPITVADLRRHCERNLARFKCPTAIEFRASLPHSAIGKVRKAELR